MPAHAIPKIAENFKKKGSSLAFCTLCDYKSAPKFRYLCCAEAMLVSARSVRNRAIVIEHKNYSRSFSSHHFHPGLSISPVIPAPD